MKKSILNLEGAQELTRKEQKNISGGGVPGLPCGADCTQVGYRGCKSQKCVLGDQGDDTVAHCVC